MKITIGETTDFLGRLRDEAMAIRNRSARIRIQLAVALLFCLSAVWVVTPSAYPADQQYLAGAAFVGAAVGSFGIALATGSSEAIRRVAAQTVRETTALRYLAAGDTTTIDLPPEGA